MEFQVGSIVDVDVVALSQSKNWSRGVPCDSPELAVNVDRIGDVAMAVRLIAQA